MSIVDKLNSIQVALVAGKSQRNDFAKFNYRTCEGILAAVKPLLNGCIVTLSDDIKLYGDRVYVNATATIRCGEESLSVSAFARECLTKKGMDEAQITGSASSYARKYALNGLFMIDDNKDVDSVDHSANAVVQLSDTDKQWVDAVKADKTVLDTITDPAYKDFIKKESEK